jgi:adenylate kinase
VFLGPPGVGKGTYASRVAAALGVEHVAAGDLVRAEIKAGSPLGLQAREAVAAGRLLPNALVLALVRARLAALAPGGYLLDGFPRTLAQAEALYAEGDGGGGVNGSSSSSSSSPSSPSSPSSSLLPALAVNLSLREEVLVDKCVGRRVCGRCGKGFNVADIRLAVSADGTRPEIVMPPLSPPPECAARMETREDDTEPVVRRRLAAYRAEAGPVEAFFERRGALLDFEITGGIPQTLPRLARALAPYHSGGEALLAGSGGGGGGGGAVDKQKRDKAVCGDKQAAARAAAAGG